MINKINPYDEFKYGTWKDAFIRFLEAIEVMDIMYANDPDNQDTFELSASEDASKPLKCVGNGTHI